MEKGLRDHLLVNMIIFTRTESIHAKDVACHSTDPIRSLMQDVVGQVLTMRLRDRLDDCLIVMECEQKYSAADVEHIWGMSSKERC